MQELLEGMAKSQGEPPASSSWPTGSIESLNSMMSAEQLCQPGDPAEGNTRAWVDTSVGSTSDPGSTSEEG
jgi:hypothetical protein